MTTPKLKDVKTQASAFRAVRGAHKSEAAEDYVELIADLIAAEGEARLVELARRLGIAQATVNRTIKRLDKEGYVVAKPYRSIFLTDKGAKLAADCRKRHDIVVSFLLSLGITPQTAELDAEGIEHHVSRETLKAFDDFAKKNG